MGLRIGQSHHWILRNSLERAVRNLIASGTACLAQLLFVAYATASDQVSGAAAPRNANASAAKILPANEPILLTSGGMGDPLQGALVHDDAKGEYVLIGGGRSDAKQPYDVMSFTLRERVWRNVFPQNVGAAWGPEIGDASPPGFDSGWWGLFDTSKFPRPHFRRWAFSFSAFQWTHVKRSNQVFFLYGNHTIAYNIDQRAWRYYTLPVNPAGAPLTVGNVGLSTQRLLWSSLVADASANKLLLFGGTNTSHSANGDIGSWIFDIPTERWRKIEGTLPPRRAYSQMVTDPDRNKVLLFGGDALDYLRSDTWVFDFAAEKWEEMHPKHRPSPRFGHAMVFLPRSRQTVLWSGWEYNPDYATNLHAHAYRYKLPLELWRWDWDRGDWRLIRAIPTGSALNQALGGLADPTAANDEDVLLFYRHLERYNVAATTQTWALRVDASIEDQAGTAARSVADGSVLKRAGQYDPSWFAATNPVSRKEMAAHKTAIANAPANTWVRINTPNRPSAYRDWGTAAVDPERQKIYRWSGGHSSYSGNDVLAYDIATNRFSISYTPELPLEWIGTTSGIPGDVSFKGRPFISAHSYKMYAYVPAFGKVVVVKSPYTYFYNPDRFDFEPQSIPFEFKDQRDNVMVSATSDGLVAWSNDGVFALRNDSAGWKRLTQPVGEGGTPHRDSSSLLYDSTRNRMLFFPAGNAEPGQVLELGASSSTAKELKPQGMAGIKSMFPSPEFGSQRMFRDAVYIPEQDVVLVPKIISATASAFQLPVYDVAENAWYAYEFGPASVAPLFTRETSSASTSMIYDPVNARIWALDYQANIWILRLDKTTASRKALR